MTQSMQYPSDRFAAFLAHCLNSAEFSSVNVDRGSLHNLLTDALSTRYAEPMLHHPGYAWSMSAEEAADRYLQISVWRPLQLSPRVQVSIAHRLLEAICHRGVEPLWSDATVARELEPPPGESVPRAIPKAVQKEFTRCSQALSMLPDRISPGSPSPSIRARFGAVVLRLYTLNAKVVEEISIWDAVECGPTTLNSLPPGKSFNDFCCLMIDAIRTAHRPYQELVGLGRGLSPFDWMDALSIQQTRALRKFLRETAGADSQADWEQAWERAPVAGFKSGAELWNSAIGRALRQPASHPLTDRVILENLADPDSLSAQEAILEQDSFEYSVENLRAREVINTVEATILIALYGGRTQNEILTLPGVREHLNAAALSYEKLLESLERRIQEWAASRPEEES